MLTPNVFIAAVKTPGIAARLPRPTRRTPRENIGTSQTGETASGVNRIAPQKAAVILLRGSTRGKVGDTGAD